MGGVVSAVGTAMKKTYNFVKNTINSGITRVRDQVFKPVVNFIDNNIIQPIPFLRKATNFIKDNIYMPIVNTAKSISD